MKFTRRHFLGTSTAFIAAACTPALHKGYDADVIILGAGLAGLHAARMLAEDGANVLILEASNRIGGRMWSLSDLPGAPEAGGQQVGQSYARIRSTALNLGLNITPPRPGGNREKTKMCIRDSPLICLHQSPKSSLEFEVFMLAAARDRSVYAADYPGYGMSDPAPSEHETTIEMYARNMWQMADALGLEQVDLFGNHTGAKVATEMALQKPDRTGCIAMVSAPILTDEERAMFMDLFKPIPLDEDLTRLKTIWDRIASRRVEGATLEWMDRSLFQTMMGGEAYEWGHVAAFSYGEAFDRALTKLPHRKIILNPADDLQECTRRATAIMRNGEVIECPQWGYGFLDFHADAICDLILPKLDEA